MCFPASVLPGENPNPQQREKPPVQNTNRISSTGKWSYFPGGGGGVYYTYYTAIFPVGNLLWKRKKISHWELLSDSKD